MDLSEDIKVLKMLQAKLDETIRQFAIDYPSIDGAEGWRISTTLRMLCALRPTLDGCETTVFEKCSNVKSALRGIFTGWIDASEEFSAQAEGKRSSYLMHEVFKIASARVADHR